MPDRGKGGFNRIAGADALPMLRRKVEECHEFGPILLQAVERQPPCPRATTTLAGFQAAEVGVFSVFRVRFLLRFGCR